MQFLLAREEEKVRTCERNNMETPRSVKKEGEEVLQAPELILLQAVMMTMVKQAVPLQAMEIHLQPMGEVPTLEQGNAWTML
ncbi:hypothetical protein TURU_008477 [Turdus rufiventris]|nr:hypothetical protein TURU_008477 [Turdus rufiventris]